MFYFFCDDTHSHTHSPMAAVDRNQRSRPSRKISLFDNSVSNVGKRMALCVVGCFFERVDILEVTSLTFTLVTLVPVRLFVALFRFPMGVILL